jgi:hypothetical protein
LLSLTHIHAVLTVTPTFAPKLFDTLPLRMAALQRFVQAARRVVLRARLVRRLRQIQACVLGPVLLFAELHCKPAPSTF